MKKLLVVFALFASLACAQSVVRESAEPLEGALSTMDGAIYLRAYLPGYGLQLSGRQSSFGNLPTVSEVTDFLATQTTALAPTIRGLAEGEWVSVTLALSTEDARGRVQEITVRVKHDDPTTLEIWIDGELQP